MDNQVGRIANGDIPVESSNSNLWRVTIEKNFHRKNISNGSQVQVQWIMNHCRDSIKNILKESIENYNVEIETMMDKTKNDTIYCCVHLNHRNSKKCDASHCGIVSESMGLSQQDYDEFLSFIDSQDSNEEFETSNGVHRCFSDGVGNVDDGFLFQLDESILSERHFKRCPQIPVNLPDGYYLVKKITKNEYTARLSQSLGGSPVRRLPATPIKRSNEELSGRSAEVDPTTEDTGFAKCSPRHRRHCLSSPRLMQNELSPEPPDERVPHMVFKISPWSGHQETASPNLSRKLSSANRSISHHRIAPSPAEECAQPTSEQRWCCGNCNRSRLAGMGSRLMKYFRSEGNILHRLASRFNEGYCKCCLQWWRVAAEYKQVSKGIQKMNRDNR